MNIDPTGLEEVAKPGIENSLSHYKNAYSALKAIDLPSGAKTQYKEKISSIFANIEALMSEVIGDVDKYISDLKDANISTEITVEKSTEKNIFATIGNTLLAGAKGLYSGIEWIADGAVSLYGNFHGAVLSAEAKVISWFDPKFAGYVEHGGKEVKNTLIDVAAHDYVDEHFDKEYNSNLKGIDQKSHIKYEDGVYETIAGVTSYIPTAATETFLPGSGTIMSFMGGYGRNQEETYENLKKGTREEIRIAAERGNISQEDYSLYESLWNMSEEEFYHCINMNQVTGNISSEEADLMKAIREMPDFEITDEMRGKVTTASVATASLETVQWIEGNWANGLKEVFGSKAGAVATRIVGDTVFNAVDTPYRALVDTMVFDKEFGEAFEDRGGWVSTGISGAIGLVGSVLGEAIDLTKGNKKTDVDAKLEQKSNGVENINDRIDVNKQTDEQVAKIVDWYKDRIGTMVDLSDEKFNVYLQRLMEEVPPQGVNPGNLTEKNKLILETIAGYINEDFKKTGAIVTKDFANHDLMTLFNGKEAASFQDQFFLKSAVADSSENGYVGVKQTMFRDKEAEYIVDSVSKISDKYEITEQEAAFLIKQTHSGGGGCSIGTTAALLTEIANKDSEKFFQKTGIVPFKEQNGKVVANTEEIYMDAFVFSNTFEDGYITKDATGKMMVDIKQNHTNSPYGYQFQGLDVDKVNAYLEANGLGKLSEKEYIRGSKSKYHTVGLEAEDMKEIAQKVNDAMQKGEMVVIGITPEDGKVVSMLMPDVVKKHGFNRDHMMKVYGANATGLVVDTTWGMRGVVSYVELMENVKDYKIKILKLEK